MARRSAQERIWSLQSRLGKPGPLDRDTECHSAHFPVATKLLTEIYQGRRLSKHWPLFQTEVANRLILLRYSRRVSKPNEYKLRKGLFADACVLARALLRGTRFLKHQGKDGSASDLLLLALEAAAEFFGGGTKSPTVNQPRV